MSFEERNTVIGTFLGLGAFVVYWVVVIARAANDDLPFTEVAWQGPMLWTIIIGGGGYAIIYGVTRYRVRGQMVADERDREIAMHAESAGAGITSLAGLAALIMLTQDASAFWVAHVLFVGSFLGSLAQSGISIAGYRQGIEEIRS